MHMLFLGAVDLEADAMCIMEPGTSMYCPELNVRLMVEHFECWAQIQHPARGCTPHCKKVWNDIQREFPECSMVHAEQAVRSQSVAKKLFGVLGLKHAAALMRSSHEICSDLQFGGGDWSDLLV